MKTAVPLFAALLLSCPLAQADDAETLALAKKSGCLACHTIDKKLVGPSYIDIAKKYRDDTDALARLTEKVKKGGKDVWGPIPMPPNVTIKDADVKTLVQWVLEQEG